jgi:hypothetical protein
MAWFAICAGGSVAGIAAGPAAGAGVGRVDATPINFISAFSSSPLTKTVKTPGASTTVAMPQRLGALRPSRRISSTLKLAARGLAWQSGFLLTQTWSQGRFANWFESRVWPCASVSRSSR